MTDVPDLPILSRADIAAINLAAEALQVPVLELGALLWFESSLDPMRRNDSGSSARGLIQFTDETARGLGYPSALALVTALPTIPQQLSGAVIPYLRRYAPFGTVQSLYMAVFYPSAMHWDSTTEFPEWVIDANRSPSGKDLIRCPADYVDLVNRWSVSMPRLTNDIQE
jgi:hypothetical protein